MLYDTGSIKWIGTLKLAATLDPKLYVSSVSAVKVDGTILNGIQHSYSAFAHLLTINSVNSGVSALEIVS